MKGNEVIKSPVILAKIVILSYIMNPVLLRVLYDTTKNISLNVKVFCRTSHFIFKKKC